MQRTDADIDVAGYYDEYSDRQVRTGINDRHRSILRYLRAFGLHEGQSVLEIGCGVGTLTELLVRDIGPSGYIFATDLSSRSIEIAEELLGHHSQLRLVAGDVLQIECEEQFDVVVLPDVIEHIPLELHRAVFGRVAGWVKKDGFVLLHYPNPHHLAWQHQNQPEALQIIDQPVHANLLTENAYATGLYLSYYQQYAIWHSPEDYVVAVLRPVAGLKPFTKLPVRRPSVMRRAVGKTRRYLGTVRGRS